MSLLPSFRPNLRLLPLLGGAILLTQLPAFALLLLGGWPGATTFGVYCVASVAAVIGLFAAALALWSRVARIVALVESFVELGRLPDPPPSGLRGSLAAVQASLKSLDTLIRRLEAEAARDPLTGVYNRRAGAVRLREDLARARRSTTPLSVAVFDLDELKAINDQWGHSAGDAALRRLSQVLGSSIREGDWVARWGGDEFLVGLWNADEKLASAATKRILSQLSGEALELEDACVRLGSGVGIAEMRPDDDADRLFARADEALLQAKRQR